LPELKNQYLNPFPDSDPSHDSENRPPLNSNQILRDQPHAAHAILGILKTIAEKKAWPLPTEKQELVIVGGDWPFSCWLYHLKKYNAVILEQGSQFGGNSKGEKMGDTTHSIGAAYIGTTDKGDPVYTFLKKLGIYNNSRRKEEDFDFLFTDTPIDEKNKNCFS